MVKTMTLKQLQSAVAKEKSKAKTSAERRALEKELRQLKAGTSTKLLKRFGRGFVVLGKAGAKATGRGIVKARKFAEESGAGEGLDDIRLSSALPGKSRTPTRTTGTTTIRRTRRTPRGTLITRRVKVTTRRVRSRPRKKNRRTTRQSQDNGFFGNLSDLGI